MKKRLLILSIFASTLLAGCGNGVDVEKKDLNPKIIEANAKEQTNLTKKAYFDCKSTFSADDLEYLGNGLARYSIGVGYYNFQNVLLNRQIIFRAYGSNYKLYNVEYINFCVATRDSDSNYYLYDSYGNKLLSLSSLTSAYGIYASKLNDKVYLTVQLNQGTKYFEYSGQLVKEIDRIPSSSTTEEQPVIEVGSLYVGIQNVDLKDFGNSGYYLSSNGNLITTFNAEHNAVATFSFPQSSATGVVGNKFLFQETYETSIYAEEYDYVDSGKKYVINTYSIDYLTGKKSNISMNYKLGSINSYKDESKLYKLGIVSAQPILNNKVLGKSETYLMDSKLEFIQNITNENLTSFVKLNSGYFYNTASKILYNENLKPVTYLNGVSVSFYENLPNYIIISDGNKVGAISTKGIVVAECKYDSFLSGNGNKLIFKKDSSYFTITQEGRTIKEKTSEKFEWITANLFKRVDVEENVALEIHNEDQVLLKLYSDDTVIKNSEKVTVSGSDYAAYVVCYTDSTEITCAVIANNSSY